MWEFVGLITESQPLKEEDCFNVATITLLLDDRNEVHHWGLLAPILGVFPRSRLVVMVWKNFTVRMQSY